MINDAQTSQLDVIDHVAVTVDDIAKSVSWYQEKFHCTVEYQDKTWAFLSFRNIRLALVLPAQHPSHIALSIGNAQDYGALKTHRDGTRSIYIKDPAGNAVELIDRDSLGRD